MNEERVEGFGGKVSSLDLVSTSPLSFENFLLWLSYKKKSKEKFH